MKKLTILGSTGSIGRQTLDVCAEFGYPVHALACGKNINLLAEQIERFKPVLVSVSDKPTALALESMRINSEHKTRILWGREGLKEIAEDPGADMLVAAMVGIAGLEPVLQAIAAGKDIALANKEVLVTAGYLVESELKRFNKSLFPVDSEHSAIWQCMWGNDARALRRIFLTASGGPFLNHSSEELSAVTLKDALKHPTWNMGGKITIDSASLMNKGLELIEAMHLFHVQPEQIEILVHPQSIIHSMVEWQDGSVLAQLSHPDMRLPIQVALAYPDRLNSPERRFDPWSPSASALSFTRADTERFPCLALAQAAAKAPKSLTIVMNAANEIAVDAFLREKINFMDIPKIIEKAMNKHSRNGLSPAASLAEIWACDETGRRLAQEEIPSLV